MGEVVELNNYKDMTPRFSLEATMDEEGSWRVAITDFYDDRMDTHAVYREIAEALIPIAGGMVHSAEDLEPTKNGCIMTSILLFQGGHIDFRSHPLDTKERKDWVCSALDRIKRNVRKG
jgi:hypothetical protein